jgi:hypothetical protein
MSVTLRPARADDAAWLAGWLPAVASACGYDPRQLIDAVAASDAAAAQIVERGGAECGIVRTTYVSDSRTAIQLVAMLPSAARSGAGMAAAALVEAELRRAGARSIIAPAPERHGIAVYFWIRLGYRPLSRVEWPASCDGVAWFAREFDDATQTNGSAVPR